MKKLGVIINPIAGIGGKVGLKGSDGFNIQSRAQALGATPSSPLKSIEALKGLTDIKDQVEIVTYPNEMGENEALQSGLNPTVIGSIINNRTTGKDTWHAARDMENLGVDLLLFAGGDGTARDIFDAVGQRVTTVGIPTGVKIYSGVFAITPRSAGILASLYLKDQLLGVHSGEVMDIDEVGISRGLVEAKLYGYLNVPNEQNYVQQVKQDSGQNEEDLIAGIITEITDSLDDDRLYVMGPGTTIGAIMEHMKLKNTLLGVDVVLNRTLVASDVGEAQLIELIHNSPTSIILTVIGGQGYILGRGNQQLSPRIIRLVGKNNITIVSTRNKLASLHGRPLLVDTGDKILDKSLEGYWKLVTGNKEYAIYKVGL